MPPGNPSKCWRDYLVVLVKALFWKAEFREQANMKMQFVIARTKTNGQTVAKLHTTARSAASQTWKTFSKTHPAHPVHPGASRCIPGIGHWTSAAIFYMHEVDVYVPPIRTLTVLCIYVYITVTVYSSFYHDIRVCVCVCFLFLSSFGPRSKPFRIRGTLAILSFRMLKFWCVEWSHLFLLVNLGSYPLMIELLICDDRISYHIIVPWGLFYNTIMLCFPPNWTHAAKGHYNCCLGWLKICIQCTKDARWCCCNKKMVCSVIGTKAQMKRWRCKQPWSQNGRTHAPWVYLSLPAWQGFLLIGQCSEKGKGFVDHWLGCSS